MTADASSGGSALRVLLFSKTTGFRHLSIEAAQRALEATAVTRGWTVSTTEDETVFSSSGLAAFDVVVFLMTTGDVLDAAQESAF